MKLFNHQREATRFILNQGGSGALFHSIGMGKTRTALEIFTKLRQNNPDLKLFVVCPLSLIEAAWGEDILKFSKYRYKNLHEKRVKKQKKPPFEIYIVNYEWLLHNPINVHIEPNNMIVLDESSKLKNNKSQITKTLLEYRDYFQHRVIMSGTPAPNSELEYWAQMRFLDDYIFHKSFYAFRNIYFHLARGEQQINAPIVGRGVMENLFKQGWGYAITDQKREELAKRIAPWCHFARKEDCLDLPDKIDEIRLIEMPPKVKSVYRLMKTELIAEIRGEQIVAQVALTKLMKLRQITSGFGIDPEGNAHAIMTKNHKIAELKSVLDEAGNQQVIIWGIFHYEIELIEKVLNVRGVKAKCLYGKTKDRDTTIQEFKDGKFQYLIAHPKSAGHGLTFVNSSLEIFFSLDYSWESYEQAKGRIHRPGQKNNCTYIHLLCEDSIDQDIYEILQNKGKAVEIVNQFLK